MKPSRPAIRYHGGKWRLAPWIIQHFPPHRVYVEPFGGAASVLLRKPRSHGEVYNDLDGDVVNVFRVLRDPELAAELQRQCQLTPFSRVEFRECYQPAEDLVERARRTIASSFFAHGSTARKRNGTGFRAKANRRNSTGAGDWANWPRQVPAYVERLRGVVVECRPALEVIAQQDSPDTLFYVDPPYVLDTRTAVRGRSHAERGYRHNLTDEEHQELAETLHGIEGMVVVSGYPSELYDELYRDWIRRERRANTDGGGASDGGPLDLPHGRTAGALRVSRLELVPVTLGEAAAFVRKHHRHHPAPRGGKFAIAVALGDLVVGVAIVGRPVARHLDDAWTAEVTRVATDGTRNACPKLYGACWRAARARGYRRLVTYTLQSEPGTSLRAAGWKVVGETEPRSWDRPGRPRVDRHPTQGKLRWEVGV